MAYIIQLFLLVVLLTIHSQAEKLERFDEEVKILKELLEKNKDNLRIIRPPGDKLNVTVNMDVRNILSICEKTHMWRVQLTFRHEWTDSRLQFTPTNPHFKHLLLNKENLIWTPDLFFKNEVHSEDHDLMTKNVLIRIHPDGHVEHSKKITLELFCPIRNMNKKDFICPIKIASYGHTVDEMEVHWKVDEPVHVNKDKLVINNHVLHEVMTKPCESITKMGHFGCILAEFKFGSSTCQVWDE